MISREHELQKEVRDLKEELSKHNVSASSSNDLLCGVATKAKSYAESLKFKGLNEEADCIFNLLQELKEEKLRVQLLKQDIKEMNT